MPRWTYLTLAVISAVTALIWLINVALDAAQGAAVAEIAGSIALTLVWTLCSAGWGRRWRHAACVR